MSRSVIPDLLLGTVGLAKSVLANMPRVRRPIPELCVESLRVALADAGIAIGTIRHRVPEVRYANKWDRNELAPLGDCEGMFVGFVRMD